MQIFNSYIDLKNFRHNFKGRLGLVPTMGALHDGHLSLISQIRPHVEQVMVTIFVNPTQFGPDEDLAKYPRNIEADLAKLKGLADYVYLPQLPDIYPNGETITVKAGTSAQGLDGDFRPGHFDGVATVVNILFDQTKPNTAIFGEKDYQQLMVIKDLNYPGVEILSAPTMREPDGLAMSSRNIYLTPKERKIAPKLYQILQSAIGNPQSAIHELENAGFKTQYVAQRWNRLLAAAYLGKTRLIDNIPCQS